MSDQEFDQPVHDSEFRTAMAGIEPLPQDKIRPPRRKKSRQKPARADSFPPPQSTATDGWQAVGAEQELLYQGGGLQHRQFKRLRMGQIPWETYLDLHGCTLAQAQTSLNRFLSQCQKQDLRCVLIVHGKGQHDKNQGLGIKTAVNHWLREDGRVIGFCSALPRNGGRGALYVLLRKPR